MIHKLYGPLYVQSIQEHVFCMNLIFI